MVKKTEAMGTPRVKFNNQRQVAGYRFRRVTAVLDFRMNAGWRRDRTLEKKSVDVARFSSSGNTTPCELHCGLAQRTSNSTARNEVIVRQHESQSVSNGRRESLSIANGILLEERRWPVSRILFS